MSANKWTPGPWTIYPETDGTEICAVTYEPKLPIRQIIARPVRGENWIANARLISSAPDLIEAAQVAYVLLADIRNEWPGRHTREGQLTLCLLRDAIAKACGIDPQEVQDAASVSEQP